MLGTSGSSPNGCKRFGVKNARAEEICGQKKRGSGKKRRMSGQKVHFGGQKAKIAGQKKLYNISKQRLFAADSNDVGVWIKPLETSNKLSVRLYAAHMRK